MPHANAQFADSEPHPTEEQDHFGLGIVLGIPVGEGENHLAIGRPETAGAVGQVHADQGADDAPEDEAAEPPHERLFIMRWL